MIENSIETLTRELHEALQRVADASRAPAMEAYLRHQFAFLGVSSQARKEIVRLFRPKIKKLSPDEAARFAIHCWDQPHREMQYVAMELFANFAQNPDANTLNTCRHLITHKSWWDTVDYIAPNIAGKFWMKYPSNIQPVTTQWMDSGNLWLQRSCLLFQLKYKDKLDFDLLRSFIEPLTTHPDFFIRKAIGWSLRSYARHNSEAVKQFVNTTPLHPLSRREALKHLSGC